MPVAPMTLPTPIATASASAIPTTTMMVARITNPTPKIRLRSPPRGSGGSFSVVMRAGTFPA